MKAKQKECLNSLKKLASNNTLSSMQICLLMLECSQITFALRETRELIDNIVKNQSSMAAVINTGLKILEAIKADSFDDLEKIKDDFMVLSNLAVKDAVNSLYGVKNIATISFSQSVFELIKTLRPKKVFLSLSHPAKEGEVLAKLLNNCDIKPVLFEDNSYSCVLKEIDAVVVGADAIFDNSFFNKTGTFSLALMSRYFNVPFYVVGCSCKYLNKRAQRFFKVARKPENEISDLDCERINIYFEEIPNSFVNKMFVR